nr:venom protein 302-like [Procambarus clarkii]
MAPLAVIVCLSVLVVSCHGLTCFPCEGIRCPALDTYDCPKSVVKSGCKCCHECAKVQGEDCGGSFNVHGQCAEDLSCVEVGKDKITFWRGRCMTSQEAHDFSSTTPIPVGITQFLSPRFPYDSPPVPPPVPERN